MQPETNLTKDYSVERFAAAKDKGKSPLEKIKVLQLRDQLDFYFGDSNLLTDKFLREKLRFSP